MLTIPQRTDPHIHQIIGLGEICSLSLLSSFSIIKASFLSIPFFIETRTTNPIMMKPTVIQSNEFIFTPPFYELKYDPTQYLLYSFNIFSNWLWPHLLHNKKPLHQVYLKASTSITPQMLVNAIFSPLNRTG